MKTLYIECNMGAAGDMLMAALLELTEDREGCIKKMNSLGIPGVEVKAEKAEKCGIAGTHVRVTVGGEEEISQDIMDSHAYMHEHGIAHSHGHGEHGHSHDHHHEEHEGHHHEHHHTASGDVRDIIDGLDVSDRVKADAKAVYALIAEAESRVHGKPADQVHFHEVGAMDAVADVVGVCMLMEQIAADRVIASPVHVGSGFVRCAHGVLPVPAPATALLLEGIPSYGGSVKGELCTPTGAALLRYFAHEFGERPVMRSAKIGYGMGLKDFERANCVRIFLGDAEDRREGICKLECNIDDMSGEELGFAMERLFESGARDVYTVPIGMKKSRPGVMLCVICLPDDADRLASHMMKHTTTIGVRRQDMQRYVLDRRSETVQTEYGPVRIKTSSGMGVEKSKAEYEDLAAIARDKGISLAEARKLIK